VRRLLVTANVVPSSPILVTLMMEVLHSSDTPVLTTATQRYIPEDTILHYFPFCVETNLNISHNVPQEPIYDLHCKSYGNVS
jgi:hypothetical protein